MEPVTLIVVGAVGALSSLSSALFALLTRKKTATIEVRVGSTTVRVAPSDKDSIENAIKDLQDVLKSAEAGKVTPRNGSA